MRCVALLRGVNVGGARTLPMRALEEAFRAAGATGVATLIQSGNVVFEFGPSGRGRAAAGAAIEAKVGFRPPIVWRSADAWRAMVEANPFVAAGAAAETLHIACLAGPPDQSAAALLDPQDFLPDEFVAAGADVYLKLPNGVAKSKLAKAGLDKAFGTVATMRNWRTVLRLLERLES